MLVDLHQKWFLMDFDGCVIWRTCEAWDATDGPYSHDPQLSTWPPRRQPPRRRCQFLEHSSLVKYAEPLFAIDHQSSHCVCVKHVYIQTTSSGFITSGIINMTVDPVSTEPLNYRVHRASISSVSAGAKIRWWISTSRTWPSRYENPITWKNRPLFH